MLKLTTTLPTASIMAALLVTNPVLGEEKITHKTVEIKAIDDQDIKIFVEADGSSQTVHISDDELADSKALEAKLASLDKETRDTVIDALQGLRSGEMGEREIEKVVILNKGENEHMVFMDDGSENMDVEILEDGKRKIVRKHIIHGDGPGGMLKGHSDAITKLIERGEFSQAELDKIQAAIDAKR